MNTPYTKPDVEKPKGKRAERQAVAAECEEAAAALLQWASACEILGEFRALNQRTQRAAGILLRAAKLLS